MGNLSKKLIIDISVKTCIVENIQIGADCNHQEIASFTCLFKEFRDVFSWSFEEMPGIDPLVVENEIKVYENARIVSQRLRPVHPRKTSTIKTKVEKLLCVGFVYPIPLTEWVSNLAPIDKK